MRRAEEGDRTVLAELRPLVDATPGLWDRAGDVAGFARRAWTDLVGTTNQFIVEAVEHKAEELRQELLGDAPTPLERLLVERVVLCWIQVHYLEAIYARQLGQSGGMSWAADAGHQRRQDRANRRYLSAIKTLAQVRRLLVPAVQINVAERQIISQGAPSITTQEPQR
jgi:hypothetical protein